MRTPSTKGVWDGGLTALTVVLLTAIGYGQAPSLTFTYGTVNACYLDTVLVPVTVTDYDGIVAFSTYADWDYDSLAYLGLVNHYPAELEIEAEQTNPPGESIKYVFSTPNLLSTNVDDARSFPAGDTLFTLRLLMRARGGSYPIVNAPAFFTTNNFSYADGPTVKFADQMTLVDGAVHSVALVEGFTVGGADLTCANPEVTLRATAANPATQFRWRTGGATVSVVDSLVTTITRTYTVTAFREEDCVSELTFTNVIDTALVAPDLVTRDLDCTGAAAVQEVTNPQPDYDYVWLRAGLPLGTGASLAVTEAGPLTLVATDTTNGCRTERTFTVEPPAPRPELANAAAAVRGVLNCTGQAATLTVPLDPATYDFAWANGGAPLSTTDSALVVTVPGDYTLTVTDPTSGCGQEFGFTVPVDTLRPAVTLAGDPFVDCRAATTVLTAEALPGGPAYDYAWTTPAGPASGDQIAVGTGNVTLRVTDPNNGCTQQLAVTVADRTARPATGLPPALPPATCTDPTPTITVSGAADRTYEWQSAAGPVATGASTALPAGDYRLIVENTVTGCRDTAALTIVADTLRPSLGIDSTGALDCTTDAVQLTLSAGGTPVNCSWNGAPADCTLAVSAAGDYVGRVTDPTNGCFAERTVSVVATAETTPLALLPADTLDCRIAGVTLALADPGTGIDYVWTDATGTEVGTGPTLTVAAAGDYRVGVAGQTGNCRRTALATVVADTVHPTVTLPTIALDCATPTAPLTFASPDAGLTTRWTDPAGNLLTDLTARVGGGYVLEVTRADNGCRTVRTLDVTADFTPPQFSVDQPNDIRLTCAEPALTATVTYAGDYAINWSDAPGTIVVAADAARFVAAGEVLLTVTNNDNGCRDSVRFTVADLRAELTPDYTAPQAFNCGQTAVTVTFNDAGALDYRLLNAAGTQVPGGGAEAVVVDAPGTYVVEVTDPATGCGGRDTLTIRAPESGLRFAGLTVRQQVCEPGSVAELELGDGGGGLPDYRFTFRGREYPAFDVVTDVPDGTYDVRLTDARDCFVDTTITVRGYAPFAVGVAGLASPYRLGDPIELTVAPGLDPGYDYTYRWMFRDTVCDDCTGFRQTAERSDFLELSVERSDGCTETFRTFVVVDENERLYLPTAFSPNDDGINDVYLPLAGREVAGFTGLAVYDRWGKLMYEERSEPGGLLGWNGRVGAEPAGVGPYVATLTYTLADGRMRQRNTTFTLLR